jgi:hypothetical protein
MIFNQRISPPQYEEGEFRLFTVGKANLLAGLRWANAFCGEPINRYCRLESLKPPFSTPQQTGT